ncbi:MAG: hypothetical protein EBT57_10730, partial [Verrucomicrobia bacterium]|nr:hypothetical protein [Verrucomicrobiota bacterium]
GSTAGTGELAFGISDFGGNAISLVKSGSGTWTLSGANNSYSGTTTVNGGTLAITGVNSGSGIVTVSGSGAVLKLGLTNSLANGILMGASSSSNTATVDLGSAGDYSIISIGSSGSGGGNMNFTNSSGGSSTLTFTAATNVITTGGNGGRVIGNLSTNLAVIFNGAVDISSSANNDLTFNAVGNITVNGGVVNNSSGIRSLIKNGTGTLTLAGNDNYNGTTTLNAGTLSLVGNKSTVAMIGTTNTATLNLQGGALTIAGTGSDFTNSATVIGSGSIVKNGSALMYLNNAGGTFSGGLTLNAGEVAFVTSGNYGAGVVTNSVFGTGTLTLNGGILRSSSDTSGRNIANSVILGGDLQFGKT